eukprot:symbB.v1.2.032741.t1/scaffold3969.1/size47216/1
MGPSTSIDCDSSSAGMALMLGATAVTPATERRTSSGGDSEAAICGGVFLQMTPFMWPRFGAYMNPNGRCFSFDQANLTKFEAAIFSRERWKGCNQFFFWCKPARQLFGL